MFSAKWRVGRGVWAVIATMLLVLLFGIARLFVGVPVHVDEPSWIAASYYFERFAAGEIDDPDWTLLPAIESPPIGKYLFGLALRTVDQPVQSIHPLAATYERYRLVPGAWGRGEAAELRRAVADRLDERERAEIQARREKPPATTQLLACRLLALAFGVIATGGVAAIGLRMRGAATALIAGLGFGLHPLVAEASTLALFDVIALAFSILTILALLPTRQAGSLARNIGQGGAIGLLMGLAIGTKMNALIVLLAGEFILLRDGWRRIDGRLIFRTKALLRVPISLAVAFGLFVAVNPSLYHEPLRGLANLFAVPAETTRIQAEFLPDFLPNLSARLAAVGHLVVGHPYGWIPLGLGILPGVWAGLRRWSATSAVLIWFGVSFAAVVLWIPFPWPRYALPVVPPAALLLAEGLVTIAAWLRHVSRKQAA